MGKILSIVCALAALILVACNGLETKTEEGDKMASVNSKDEAIISTVKEFFQASDNSDWDTLDTIFADEVVLDYSSFGAGPAETLTADMIIARWEAFLPGFDSTDHQLSNFAVSDLDSGLSKVTADVVAYHYLDNDNWVVKGSYEILVSKAVDSYEIKEFKFNFAETEGNNDLAGKAMTNAKPKVSKVTFNSNGQELVGDLYYPLGYEAGERYSAVVVTGSWTTVKEQMAANYAERLARKGFIALTYDSRGYGESEGEIRYYENPDMKIEDIKAAVTYLESLESVENIGAFGVCAGAGYTLVAASEDDRIKAVATAASWIHDGEAVKMFYGGEEGVQARIAAADAAEANYNSTGEVEYIPTYSQSDDRAAMYDPNNWYDYYNNPERGGIKEWSVDLFATMGWNKWLTFNPRTSAPNLDTPTLMIHSDGSVLPDYTKIYFDEIKTDNKKLIWTAVPEDVVGMHQFYFYDQEAELSLAVAETTDWFNTNLK